MDMICPHCEGEKFIKERDLLACFYCKREFTPLQLEQHAKQLESNISEYKKSIIDFINRQNIRLGDDPTKVIQTLLDEKTMVCINSAAFIMRNQAEAAYGKAKTLTEVGADYCLLEEDFNNMIIEYSKHVKYTLDKKIVRSKRKEGNKWVPYGPNYVTLIPALRIYMLLKETHPQIEEKKRSLIAEMCGNHISNLNNFVHPGEKGARILAKYYPTIENKHTLLQGIYTDFKMLGLIGDKIEDMKQ